MTRYVIDAAALVSIVDGGRAVDPAHQLVAPKSVLSDALQLLLDEVRAGRRSEKAARETHERMTELKMRLLGDRMSRGRAWRIAREHDWGSLRDAEYAAITQLQGDALVALDPGLAARLDGVVPQASLDEVFRAPA